MTSEGERGLATSMREFYLSPIYQLDLWLICHELTVSATPTTSRPVVPGPAARFWMSVGATKPRASKARLMEVCRFTPVQSGRSLSVVRGVYEEADPIRHTIERFFWHDVRLIVLIVHFFRLKLTESRQLVV